MKNLLFYLVYGIIYLLSLLPLWVHYLFSDLIYVVVYHLLHYRVDMVRKHLADSFPEKSEAERREIEKGFYGWFCDYLVETLKLLTMSKRQLRRRMVFRGTELIDQTVADGQSCAVYLGHYCNWEWVTSLPLWVSPEAQCGQIYHALENAIFDRLFLKLRQRMGAVCIPMAETLRRIVKYRQEGREVVIGYISDQTPFWNNIHHWLDFLNHDTPVLTGTERLARQTGHAVFYLDVRCVRRGYYEAEFKLITRDPKAMKEFEITDSYFRQLEESIRRAPQYYLWTHNRWKRTHEEFNIRYDPATGHVSLEYDLEKLKREKGLI
jgi:KDO2-lipid IV(A) lauroyltransferase